MEANLDKPGIPRPSFLSSVELSPRTGLVDASDIKKDLYGDFSAISDISQRESLESKGRIHVCLRIRPFMQTEKESEFQECVSVLDPTSIVVKAPKSSKMFRLSEKNLAQLVQKFTFSQVFGSKTTQEELFEGTVKQPVIDFIKGHSRLVFTYGVTNAGKTYTYQGTEEDSGILPRALDLLFKRIQSKLYPEMNLKPHRCRDHRKLTKEEIREEMSTKNSLLRLVKEIDYPSDINGNRSRTDDNSEDSKEPVKEAEQSSLDEERDAKFSIWVSFCEIYNEYIYDLLLPISSDKRRKVLRLAQDIKGCSYVKDLQWIHISNSKEAFKLMKLGLKHQRFASTKLNANSSRSHSIFTVKMLKIDPGTTSVMQVNELFLCDLAGSERCTRTHNEGERLKESGNINTSLLILGKCINALKTSQQSKLQQHIPFRESKLTHFFQGFFSGKGKVCMIVNVSQSASAYDETLNVLRFSAIAQQVIVLDSSNSPQEESLDQLSVKAESETITEDVCLPIKRATMFLERTLEDVMEEEEELIEVSSRVHEVNGMAENTLAKKSEPEVTEESPSQVEYEDDDIIIGKEKYQRLLNIIEDLKNKLIDEKKDKLHMELRIREEVTQECAQYLAKKESDIKTLISYREEMMEDHCEERMQIYKDLVKDCILLTHDGERAEEAPETQANKPDGTSGGEPGEPGSAAELSGMVELLQQNVADIKQQAEMAYEVLDAFEEPQATIERLEKQLAAVTVELSQTREELLCSNKVGTVQENTLSESTKVLQDATEKMALQNKRIQELSQVVEQKDDEISRLQVLITHLEAIIKDSENTIAAVKQEMEQQDPNKASCTHASVSMEKCVGTGRKRCLEREKEEEGPPAKQGSIHNYSKDAIETKQLEEMQPHTLKERGEMVALKEKNNMLDIQLTTLREELEKEKTENEGFSRKIASLSQELLSSEERASGLSKELNQQQANCGKIMSELVVLKDINKGQGERIQLLLQELEAASQTIAEQKSKIKVVEVKIGELNRSQWPVLDVDEANGKEMAELPKEGHEPTHVNLDQNGSFHCSIDSIWAVSQQIVHASSQKSSQIEGLLQQVEQLQRRAQDAEDEKCQLNSKLSESLNQKEAALREKECLLNQLRDLRQENALYAKKFREEENRALGYFEKLKNNDGLLEACRAREASIACLEQTLKDKESAILDMERTVKDMQEKLNLSESRIREFNDQEAQLKAEVLELRSNLRNVELQEKDKEESKQAMEQLNKQLSESVALSSHLQLEIQRKDEEYVDLKEKLADAKKQIEQVQREVCSMRAEEKSLRSKVNEFEKAKNQLTEELDIKQRTIQQFKKEELNKKLEDISQQYQSACKDLCSKEKIIEDMKLTLEEQEQTQSEQDEILEARLEENERCVAELEEWKRRYLELEKQSSRLQQTVNVECEKSTTLPDELKRLQQKLKEYEEQHNTDRKKWLAEKMLLITQAKEAETHRNREMKRFAGDRENHARQLEEAEKLVTKKEDALQKWHAERDQLVAALEVQLSSLAASNAQKDKEIEELKRTVLKAPGKACKRSTSEELRGDGTKELKWIGSKKPTTVMSPIPKSPEKNKGEDLSNCEQLKEKQNGLLNCNNVGDPGSLLQGPNRVSSVEHIQDQSDAILDSCEVSSESGQTSRFPKPEMEIQFTPLQPNKMEVKHQGSPSTVTIKVPKARKRKSNALDEDFLKSENEKNATSLANTSRQKKKTALGSSLNKKYPLRSKGLGDTPRDAGGTLQKFGHFLQTSPSIIQSKAKKLMATIQSPKSTEEECVKENDVKPKRAKRRLYSTDISSPMEFSGHVIVLDQKESDHEIIKRRLRTKKMH
ncbi:kinesin-like protein KIF20B [Elgaria multicarinata webbii]|uniref:kinesin-like protein KIF20B n=1 Tax=Elgaria multicarinata webbii TaxID=159646 RepID=UPI002FCD3924